PGKASRPGGRRNNNDICRYATTFHYRGNIPPWHTQNMGPEIPEVQIRSGGCYKNGIF
ncbi:hypothetical protein A2U01_0091137, partial [Trifolium medium]|nr:hypothetical protein [Trifolium medium]